MRCSRGFAFVLVALVAVAADAQSYPSVAPTPHATDRASLAALAQQREIVERLRLGLAALAARDASAAATQFARVLALHPHEPQASTAYYDLGLADAGLARFDRAASAFESAIARDPNFIAARVNLVSALLAEDDLTAARVAADALVAIAPESARALYARGVVALRAGDAATARSDFRRLLGNDPTYAVGHYDLALAEEKLGSFTDAERELRAALALAPRYTRASIALGAVLLREGKRDEARATFDSAATDTSDIALRNLALSLRDAVVR